MTRRSRNLAAVARRVYARYQAPGKSKPQSVARVQSQRFTPFDDQFPSSIPPINVLQDFLEDVQIGVSAPTCHFDQPELALPTHRDPRFQGRTVMGTSTSNMPSLPFQTVGSALVSEKSYPANRRNAFAEICDQLVVLTKRTGWALASFLRIGLMANFPVVLSHKRRTAWLLISRRIRVAAVFKLILPRFVMETEGSVILPVFFANTS